MLKLAANLFHCRPVGQIPDHVCYRILNTLPGPVHDIRVSVQLCHEGYLHSVIVCYAVLHVQEVPGNIR